MPPGAANDVMGTRRGRRGTDYPEKRKEGERESGKK